MMPGADGWSKRSRRFLMVEQKITIGKILMLMPFWISFLLILQEVNLTNYPRIDPAQAGDHEIATARRDRQRLLATGRSISHTNLSLLCSASTPKAYLAYTGRITIEHKSKQNGRLENRHDTCC